MKLRNVITSLSLAAPLTSCCLSEDWQSREVDLPATPSDTELGLLIKRCTDLADCQPLCEHDWFSYAGDPLEVKDCKLTIADGRRVLTYQGLEDCTISGRRPRRYHARAQRARTRIGAYLAGQAALEAASVRAFADLHADLVAHRAPLRLQRAAITAAGDEIRHAQACARLARCYGGIVRRIATPAAPRRSLRELAIDNIVEGCVRETFGAIVAGYQGRAAADPAIRHAMTAIAHDEATHAELAWQLHRWLEPRLTAGERRVVARAARRAHAELRAAAPPDHELARVVGLPDAAAMAFIVDHCPRG